MSETVTLSTPTRSVTTTIDSIAQAARAMWGETDAIANGDRAFDIPRESEFYSQDFIEAPSIQAIADSLIGKWDEFFGFEDLQIRYVWKKKGGTKGGMLTLGTCQKASGLAAFFGECDYVISIAADNTRAFDFTKHQMVALTYHELCHISLDEDEKTGDIIKGTRTHDVEMFFNEIKRYGLWKNNLEAADRAFAQLRLPESGN